MKAPSLAEVQSILGTVMDPEIPVLSVVDMGLIRDARWDESTASLEVDITPTYSGCPAMQMIEEEVVLALQKAGFKKVKAKRVYSPAWTTDWIGPEAREKLKKYGIAPPGERAAEALFSIGAKRTVVECPFCNSTSTERKSEFGSTACKSMYFCSQCRQPFEHFKAI